MEKELSGNLWTISVKDADDYSEVILKSTNSIEDVKIILDYLTL